MDEGKEKTLILRPGDKTGVPVKVEDSSKPAIQIESRLLIVSEDFLEDIGLKTNSIYNTDGKFKPAIVESTASPISEACSFILDDPNVSFLLRAIQAHEDSKALTTPKVTVLDGEKVSQFIGADLPASVQNVRYRSGNFMGMGKAWIRFDVPLSDLKNLLAKSDKLPDFPDLHKNPKIQKDMDEVYKDFNIEWWKSDELENPVCAAWIKSERAKGAPKVWVVNILNICCSQLENNLMRVYISLYSHAH